jgi:hypothetical protein
LAHILSNSTKTITSSCAQYLFGLKSIVLERKMPLNSRMRVLCSLPTNLREVHLDYGNASIKGFRKSFELISNHLPNIEILRLTECDIDQRTFHLVSRFTKLKRFILEDHTWTSEPFEIKAVDLAAFYQACPDLVEVNLSSRRFCFVNHVDVICPLNLVALKLELQINLKECFRPSPKLLHLSLATNSLHFYWMNAFNFPSLTSLYIYRGDLYTPVTFAPLYSFLGLKTLKLFANGRLMLYDKYTSIALLQNLESLAFLDIVHEEKGCVTSILRNSILPMLKELTVLPVSRRVQVWNSSFAELSWDSSDEWRDAMELDQVLAPLLNVVGIRALCVTSNKDAFSSSKIVQRFQSVLYYDTAHNIQRKASLFL